MKWIRILLCLIPLLAMCGFTAAVQAAPFQGYNYSYWGKPEAAPVPYLPERTLYGQDLQIGAFKSPQDLFTDDQQQTYVADTGNNRIVVLNQEWQVEQVIDHFMHDGKSDTFNGPSGVFVQDSGHVFIADTNNRRIVELNKDGTFVQAFGLTKSSLFREGFQYAPVKVALDKAQRIYVISEGAYEGILEFDIDGVFKGFVGTNRVKFNPLDLLWKRLATDEQKGQLQLFVPIEFNNLDVDEQGFIYTTTSEAGSDTPVKRLNPSGMDVLRREGFFTPKGDIEYLQAGSIQGSSIFIDVVSDQGGIYSTLDSKRSRIFTYDKDGNLLYIFGGPGTQAGRFKHPAAIDMIGDRMIVLDKGLNRLTVFKPTRYGRNIREAVISHYHGNLEASTMAWQEVLKLNSNFEIAYTGIGRALMKEDHNREAMKYFKLGNDRKYYSEAFKRYRKQFILHHFGSIVGVVLLIIVLYKAVSWYWRRKVHTGHYVEIGVLKNPFYTSIHPFNGFWEMKYEKKGRIKIAIAILLLLALTFILKRQFTGFIVNYNNVSELNTFDEFKFVILPFLLWCTANWSLTTLMDGEGKFKDIVMASGYSLLPFILVYLPQILLSNIITAEESAFYYFFDGVAVIWFVWLLFIATMTVHQYTVRKTIITMLLTLIVIGVMIFLGLLFFSLLQQLLSFVISIYQEIAFRV